MKTIQAMQLIISSIGYRLTNNSTLIQCYAERMNKYFLKDNMKL